MRVEEQKNLDEATIEIYNDYTSVLVYIANGIRRELPVGAKMKVKVKELYELINTVGGRVMLERGMILIKDSTIREYLGLDPLDEYNPTLDSIKKMLKDVDLKELENVLMYCSETSLSKIVKTAVDLPVKNLEAAKMIQQYSGKDIISIIQELEKDKDAETSGNSTQDSSDKPVRRKKVTE